MNQEESRKLSEEILRLLQKGDLAPNEMWGVLEVAKFSILAAEIETEMKRRYGLVRND